MKWITVKLSEAELKDLILDYERYASACEEFASRCKSKEHQNTHLGTAGVYQSRANQLARILRRARPN